jgi:4-amino-4-deoxy-L-arabinose transferase-like glycosyltransferase
VLAGLQDGKNHVGELMLEASDSAKRSARNQTLAVLAVALLMRLLVLWTVATHYPTTWFFSRGMEMGLLAKSVLAGQGLSSPFGVPTGHTAFIAPVYPLLVAAVFKVFGSDSAASALVIQSVQVLLNLLTIALMMHVARKLFNGRTAVLAGLIWAVSLPVVWLPTIFWETSLSAFLLIGLLAWALRCARKPSWGMWALLGMYAAFTALVNPALLLSVIAIVAWIAWQSRRQSAKWPLMSVLAFAVVFAPWPIRNARTFHAFIPLRTTVGFELWMGNRPGATGYLDESVFPSFNKQELGDYVRMGEVAYCDHKSALAKAYITAHPSTFVRMSLLRTLRFWSGTGTEDGSALFAVHALLTTVFGFAGLWLLFRSGRRAETVLFALPLLLFPLPYMITHAEFRYRIVIDPLLAVFAAYALIQCFRNIVVDRSQIAAVAADEPVAGSTA